MSEYVLRKSVGSHSAGTRVYQPSPTAIAPEEFPPSMTVLVKPINGEEFTVLPHLLVKLRSRTSVGTTRNRRVRRAEKFKALAVISTIQNAMHREGMI